MVNTFMVYPGHGVGRVTKIETRNIFGSKHKFINLEIITSKMQILVPIDQIKTVGIRKVMSKAEGKRVIARLVAGRLGGIPHVTSTWRVHYSECLEQVKSGKPEALANVIIGLCNKQSSNELSFGERKMLQAAQTMLHTELSIVLGSDVEVPLCDNY